MSHPPWADERFSRALSLLRSRGEGQTQEFKREFPRQTTDLAKEIAALATSNGGVILLGVEGSGDLYGLPDADTPEQRGNHCKRIRSADQARLATDAIRTRLRTANVELGTRSVDTV
jgi:predicted HTH transcriptional regulator